MEEAYSILRKEFKEDINEIREELKDKVGRGEFKQLYTTVYDMQKDAKESGVCMGDIKTDVALIKQSLTEIKKSVSRPPRSKSDVVRNIGLFLGGIGAAIFYILGIIK